MAHYLTKKGELISYLKRCNKRNSAFSELANQVSEVRYYQDKLQNFSFYI